MFFKVSDVADYGFGLPASNASTVRILRPEAPHGLGRRQAGEGGALHGPSHHSHLPTAQIQRPWNSGTSNNDTMVYDNTQPLAITGSSEDNQNRIVKLICNVLKIK